MLAIATQREIMRRPLDPDDPHYRAILAAKARVSTAQITAQTRTDTRVKWFLSKDFEMALSPRSVYPQCTVVNGSRA
jgi:hypothetical protein